MAKLRAWPGGYYRVAAPRAGPGRRHRRGRPRLRAPERRNRGRAGRASIPAGRSEGPAPSNRPGFMLECSEDWRRNGLGTAHFFLLEPLSSR